MPSLAETQQLFWQLITAPEGVASGIAGLPPAAAERAACLVRGDERMSGVERLDVYASMYFFRLLEVLSEDFPALASLLGHDEFHNLVTDYLLAHPSTHFSLRYVGAHLPAFIEDHAIRRRRPCAGELARFEWMMSAAFDAPDVTGLTVADLAGIAPADWPGLRFSLSPSLHLLPTRWPLQRVWRALKAGEDPGAIDGEPEILRVWRQDLQVWHRTIGDDEHSALVAVRSGATFSEVCEELAQHVAEEEAAGRAAALLRQWIDDGLLTALA